MSKSLTCKRGHLKTPENRRSNGGCILCEKLKHINNYTPKPKTKRLTCSKGHALTPDNIGKQGRCKTCNRDNKKNHPYKRLTPRPLEGHCRKGHLLTSENTGTGNSCKTCRDIAKKARIAADPEKWKRYKHEENIKMLRAKGHLPMKPAMSKEDSRIRANERRKKYLKLYPERYAIYAHKRRQRYRDMQWDWTPALWELAKAEWDNSCAYCGTKTEKLTQDHFIPISDPACPGTVPHNMVPACNSCNGRKSNKLPDEWVSDKDRLLAITNWLATKGNVSTLPKTIHSQISLF